MANAQKVSIDISTSAIIKVLVVLLGILFVSTIKDVLFVVFIALVLAAAIDPWVTGLERRGVPRGLGVAIIYIIMLALVSLLIVLIVPMVVTQLEQLARSIPSLYDRAFSAFKSVQDTTVISGLQKSLESVTQSLGSLTQSIFSRVFGLFGGIFAFLSVLVLTFYLTLEERGMKRIATDLAPLKYRPYLIQLFNRIEDRLGRWLRGQLLLGVIIFLMTLGGLLALNVNYALVLALIAGITELVPVVGPFIGAIPAVIVAVSQNPILGLWVIVLYIVVQQLENHFIVPKVMSKATGLNPILVLVGLLVGAKLAGIGGVILAVPTLIIVTTFIEDFVEERKQEENRLEKT